MRSYLLNAKDNFLALDVASGDATIEVQNGTDLPVVPFYLVVDPLSDTDREYMYCTGVAGTTLSVTRNLEGTESLTHLTNNTVRFAYDKQHLDDIWDGIEEAKAQKLDDLVDVDVAGVSDLQVLSYDAGTDTWIPKDNLGNKGITTLEYLYDANQTAIPAAGDVSPNNAVPANVTSIAISDTDGNGDSVNFILSNITEGDLIVIAQRADDVNRQDYTVVSVVDNGAYHTIAVTPAYSGGTIADNDPVFFYYFQTTPDLDSTYLRLDATNSPMTGPIDMGGNQLNDVADGTLAADGVNLAQVRAEAVVEGIKRMRWLNAWAPGTYEQFDTVLDEPWTMVANKQTTDRAAPQPDGPAFYTYEGASPTNSQVVKEVRFGNRYSFAKFGSIQGYRLYTIAGNTYTPYVIKDPLGAAILTVEATFTAGETGWRNLAINESFVTSGTVLDLMCRVIEPDPTPTTFDGNWDYQNPQNSTVPASGVITHSRNQQGLLRINKTDNAAVDRSAELATLVVGDTIASPDVSWSIQSITDNGTWIEFGVAPATNAPVIGIQLFTFETVTATAITHMEDVNWWPATGLPIQGLFGIDGAEPALDTNAYGTDFLVQDYTVSPDWDLLASSAGGSGGGGDGSGAANGLPIGGTAGQRLNKIDGADFSTDWKDMLHADLTDVSADQHHTRYTDAEAIAAAATDTTFLPLAGGTLTGPLVLNADPTVALEAATKQYVDARDVLYLPLSGGALTGALTLAADPTLDLHAATKQYVDAIGGGGYVSPLTTEGDMLAFGTTDERLPIGLDLQYLQTVAGKPTWVSVTGFSGLHADLSDVTPSQHHVRYDDDEAISANVGLWLSIGGGTLTGPLALPFDPIDPLEAVTKQYVDAFEHHARYTDGEAVAAVALADDYVKLAGDTMTGPLVLPADPTIALEAATKAYVDANSGGLPPGGALGDSLRKTTAVDNDTDWYPNVSITTIEPPTPLTGDFWLDPDVDSSDQFLKLSGGNMSGALIQTATQALATKQMRNITAGATEPVGPLLGDVWIDTT